MLQMPVEAHWKRFFQYFIDIFQEKESTKFRQKKNLGEYLFQTNKPLQHHFIYLSRKKACMHLHAYRCIKYKLHAACHDGIPWVGNVGIVIYYNDDDNDIMMKQ